MKIAFIGNVSSAIIAAEMAKKRGENVVIIDNPSDNVFEPEPIVISQFKRDDLIYFEPKPNYITGKKLPKKKNKKPPNK